MRLSTLAFLGMAVVLLASMLACQPQDQRPNRGTAAVDTAVVEAALDSLRSAFVDAWEAGDAERIASMWADEGIQSVTGEPPIQGRDSIRAAWERFFEGSEEREVTIDSVLDVQVLGDGWAFELGTLSSRYTPVGADSARGSSSTYLLVLRRTPDGWKGYREVSGSNGPPEPTQ